MFSILLAFIALAPQFVVLDSPVRDRLAREWDATSTHQSERGYCVAYTEGSSWGVPVYRVWAIERAKVVRSSQYRITSECPADPNVAFLHTHPPVTCTTPERCVIGGPDAYECFESEIDQASLEASGDPFALIQCDRHAIIAYFPHKRHKRVN